MIDYRNDAFVAIGPDGKTFMAVEDKGELHDRELHMMGKRQPVKGARRRRS